jgi:hypothetical protein
MPRRLAVVLYAAAGVFLLWGVGRFFAKSVGGTAAEEPAGVILAPPPDALVENAGTLGAAEAARRLGELAARNPERPRVALTLERGSLRVVLVLDREVGTIEEWRGGASGTRVATVWKGSLEDRLTAARERGTFDVPGLAPPEEKNLYH